MMETFTQTGGSRIGRSYWLSMNATMPFAKLQITPGKIVLTSVSKSYAFPKEQVQRISIYSGIFSKGVQIEHSNPTYPKFIVFWSFALDELKTSLKEMGYETN